MEIIVDNLNKKFKDKNVLNDLNLNINEGMFGLLGRNGAGKTTFMRILTTLLEKDSGNIKINGIQIEDKNSIRKIIGYLPQNFSFYPNMTVYETMDYLGVLSKISKKDRRKRITMLLDEVHLFDERQTSVKALSGGMKRRLGIAQALINKPKVLIVDEPTAGLDPEERIRFRNLLAEVSNNKIVILSTHIVGDIEATCDNIGILDKGKLIYKGNSETLRDYAKDKVYEGILTQDVYNKIKKECKIISVVSRGSGVQVRLLSKGKPFDNANKVIPTIEDGYMFMLGGEDGIIY